MYLPVHFCRSINSASNACSQITFRGKPCISCAVDITDIVYSFVGARLFAVRIEMPEASTNFFFPTTPHHQSLSAYQKGCANELTNIIAKDPDLRTEGYCPNTNSSIAACPMPTAWPRAYCLVTAPVGEVRVVAALVDVDADHRVPRALVVHGLAAVAEVLGAAFEKGHEHAGDARSGGDGTPARRTPHASPILRPIKDFEAPIHRPLSRPLQSIQVEKESCPPPFFAVRAVSNNQDTHLTHLPSEPPSSSKLPP
jgi:hypothetical protein